MNAIIEAFQTQVCGSLSIFVHEYEFHNRSQGTNESFEEFYTDLQTLLNKCHYEDCCKTETRMSCKERILLARLVAGIRSNEVRKSLLCIKDLTLEKAVQHVQVDEATSFQANQFSSQINKTAASACKHNGPDLNRNKNSESVSDSQVDNPRKCKFCMRVHIFRKELCPAKDSICKACKTKGHWANSLMCPNHFNTGARGSSEQKKFGSQPTKSKFPGNPSLQFISADAKSQLSPTASVKTINLSAIPSVGSHCYADFVIGNHNWIQRCMVDLGANINCVGYDWITCFETPEWNYALEQVVCAL